jgi:hypothetical protein
MLKKLPLRTQPTAHSISSAVVIRFPVRRHRADKPTTQIVHPHIPSASERMRKDAHKRRVYAFLEQQMHKQLGDGEI